MIDYITAKERLANFKFHKISRFQILKKRIKSWLSQAKN